MSGGFKDQINMKFGTKAEDKPKVGMSKSSPCLKRVNEHNFFEN